MRRRGRKRRKNVAYVAGVSMTPVTRTLGKPHKEVAAELLAEALEDAGLEKNDIDTLVVTPPNLAGPPSFMFVCALAEYLDLRTKHINMVECGGTSGAMAIKTALNEIFLGRTEFAAVIAIDQRFDLQPGQVDINVFMHEALQTQICLYGPYDSLYGIGAPIPYYAMSAQRYMEEYGATEEDFARVAVMLRNHASKNPLAEYRDPITVEDVLNSRYLSPPLKLLDCSPFASGGACVILANPYVTRPLPKPPVWITGVGEWHEPDHFIPQNGSITSFTSVKKSAEEAFERAGMEPVDVDVAEVYGVFTATELMIYEDLGIFPPGEGYIAVKEGKATYGGNVVMNPSGGRLSLGHPAAATPVMEMVEVVRQLRGECGERQVPGARCGLVHAEHGMLNGSIVFVLEV